MEKHASKGILFLGWSEIILGGIGTVVFILSLIQIRDYRLHPDQISECGAAVVAMITMISFPSPLLLLLGIGFIKLKAFARLLNFALIVFILLVSIFVLFYYISSLMTWVPQEEIGVYKRAMILDIAILLFFILPLFIFINHPKIKKQFQR